MTNLALASVLAATGPGPVRMSPRLHPRLTVIAFVGAAALTTVSFVKIVSTKPPAPPAPTVASTPDPS